MNLSLRIKMVLAFSAVVIAAIAAIVLFTNLDSKRQVQTYMTRGGFYGVTELVGKLEEHYAENNSWVGADELISGYNFRGGRNNNNPRGFSSTLSLTDADGVVLWSNAGLEKGTRLTKEEMGSAVQLHNNRGRITGFLFMENTAQMQSDELSPFVSRMRQVIIYAGLVAAIAAILLAVLISNQLLKPVKALTKASEDLAGGNLNTRVNIRGSDELTVLGKTFNQMAGNLQLAEERKKTLTADVAHELRTPIAVQKAQLEGMLDGVLPVNQENLSTALAQTDFLSRMVDDLRLLAMADAGEIRFEYQEIHTSEIIRRVVAQSEARVSSEGMAIVVISNDSGNTDPVFLTDPDRVTQILHNLVSNAMRYGKKGGVIEIGSVVDDINVHFFVKDEGSGIPESALPHLFERFYHHEKARNRETGGTGLGLAISKKLAVLLGGDITGGNDPRGGAIFTLILPIKHKI